MQNTSIIRLCYRKIIDAQAVKEWDKLVYEDTWMEYRMQAQNFSQSKTNTSFAALLQQDANAERLHFLVSAAATAYIRQLNGIVPDITDNLGRSVLKFEQFQFEIVNSDISNKSKHQVAISFVSQPFLWHTTAGNFLLLSDEQNSAVAAGATLTKMIALQPFLSIYSVG